jgi:hypothetical protein
MLHFKAQSTRWGWLRFFIRKKFLLTWSAFLILVSTVLLGQPAWAANVTLAWDPNTQTGVIGYRIYWGTSSGTYTSSVDVGNVTTYTVMGLNSGTTYYFVATCYTGTGAESGYSNQVSTAPPAVNTPPVASNGSLTISEDTSGNGTLTATDVDGNSLTYVLVAGPGKGTVTITNSSTGSYSYIPNLNANGSDSFSFRAYDGSAYSNTATVAVTITAVNTAPVASSGVMTAKGTQPATGKLVASDADGDPLTYSIVANGTKGTATITNASTGTYTYTPNADANASDTLTFKANDGKADSNAATITVTITTGNTPPVASDGNLLVVQNSVASTLLSATDVDKDPLTYSILANGTKGTVTYLNPRTGAFIYKPAKDTTGLDSFSYKANDGKADSNVATVTVTIEPNPYTVYEDAQDRTIRGWTIFDNKPRGASVTNVFDQQKQSWVIQTKGSGIDNGYRLRLANGSSWRNTTQFIAQWSLNYSENFQIYINVNTSAGQRYLTYTPATSDQLGTSQYVYFGIGSGAIKGQWHTVTRDLQTDLERAQPGVIITQVNGMDIRGNLRIDDVMLLAQLPALDTDNDGIPDDLETNVYGTDPSKADTSHCGISDGYKLDYLGSRWNLDADGDGIINLLDDDMDNDGVLYGAEITNGTDPLVVSP